MTVAEQYQDVLNYLAAHPPIGGREPHRPPAWGGSLPLWDGRRVPDAVAQLYHEIGLRGFLGFTSAAAQPVNLAKTLDVARQRFDAWGLEPNRSVALGTYRNFPSPENQSRAQKLSESTGIKDLLQRFDYGDEIAFSEWLRLTKPEAMTQLSNTSPSTAG